MTEWRSRRPELELRQVQNAVASGELVAGQPGGPTLLTPLANDTISTQYFTTADALLASVGRSTPPPPSYNHLWVAPTPPPYARVHSNQQPYDTFIGSGVISSFEQQPTPSPLPSQDWVSQTFVSQCPFLQFGDMVYINGPKCGDQGTWTDPSTGRVLLRFSKQLDGSVSFKVDSAVHGNGSVSYAYLATVLQATSTATNFQLRNCLGVTRYGVEERLTKIENMGKGISTMTPHDTGSNGPAFFTSWVLSSANGSVVSGAPMVRINQDQVNYTRALDPAGEQIEGGLYARAHRQGSWTGSGWQACDSTTRRWQVQFTETTRNFENAGTVMDMRVATMAMITAMALRDETRDPHTGLCEYGEPWSLGRFILKCLAVILILAFVAALVHMCVKRHIPDRLYTHIFRFEQAALPKRPARLYKPTLPRTW